MCGLGLIISKKKKHTGQRMFDLYKNQAHRGKQGYGFISIEKGRIKQVFRSKNEYEARQALMKDNSEIILFHHRYPTSTKNVIGATHPIFVQNAELKYDYYVAHNGVISNCRTLKPEHEKLGYVYNTAFTEKTIATYADGRTEEMDSTTPVFNDSESLAIELARHIEGLSDKIDTRGAAAFIGIAVEKGSDKVHSLFFGKNRGRDLCVLESSKWYIVSSETGDDLADMKLWQYKLDGSVWSETDLPIDIAEPVKTVGFHNTWTPPPKSTDSPSVSHETAKLIADIKMHQDLRNARYTQKERDDTGVPPSEFFTLLEDGVKYYIPMKFSGHELTRVNFSDIKFESDKEDEPNISGYYALDEKVRDRLEELVSEYVKVENQIETMEQGIVNGFYDDNFIDEELDRLKIRQQALEDAISALGVDEEITDELLALYQDLEQYSSVPSPYHLIED